MESAAGAVLKQVGSWVVPKVEDQFSYVFSNKKHIEELDKEVKNLENKKLEIDGRLVEAERQGEAIIKRVDDWQKEADEIIIESKNFLEETRNFDAACFFKLCFNVVHLYKSGKEATRIHKNVTVKYQEAMNFVVVATPPPVAPIVVSSAATSGDEFVSREKILNEVISALQDETVDIVGIHGMGGVGKTTLVDKLILQVREQKLFNVVVKSVVSKTPNIREIQSEIADEIQFKFKAESLPGRRNELCQILSQKIQNNGKILVILDDVWEAIDITAQIGIPRMKCCKVVITSRKVDVLRVGPINANCQLIQVGVLENEEAKLLFVKSLGNYYSTIVNDSQFTTIIEGLLKRCGGLPLALVTLAGALKGKDHHIWNDAYVKLSKHSGRKIDGMSEKVWSTIKFSYDSLQNEEVKKILLLCSLFPEDANIPVQKLVSYGFGIDLFGDSCRLDEAMIQVHGFIDQLVSCSLLLPVEINYYSDTYCVRVHDIIRDVAMDIASHEYNWLTEISFHEKQNPVAISLFVGDSEDMEEHLLDFSKLKILRLQCKRNVRIPTDFFKGMEKLKVLDLVVCNVVSFSILDPLTSLEHLFLEDRTIEELPSTFEGFTYLKVLDLSRSYRNMKIPANFIAGLFQLEGLLLAYGQFINIVELQWCPRLRILHAGLGVTNGQQIPQEVASNLKHLSSFKLVVTSRQSITLNIIEIRCSPDKLFPKTLALLNIQSATAIPIHNILSKGLHSLHCYGVEGLTDLKMVEPSMLRVLVLQDCNISYLFGADVGLPKIECMRLWRLPRLEGICELKAQPNNMLNATRTTTSSAAKAKTALFPHQELVPALKELRISRLPPDRMTYVFPSLTLSKQTLTTLQRLYIDCCDSVTQVIESAEEGDEMDVASPIVLSLEELYLKSRWRPFRFYEGKHTLMFPLLQHLNIDNCISFMPLAATSEEGGAYSRLESVNLHSCKDMKYVFAANAVFSKLKGLLLEDMSQLEDICGHDGEVLWKNSFPALKDVTLHSLPKIMNNNITDSLEVARKYLFGPEDVLPTIETMDLVEIGCAEVWHLPNATAGSFSHLTRLTISTMPHLKYLFPSLAFCTHTITRLVELKISRCENMEVVFFGGDEQAEDKDVANHNIIPVIPVLKEIYLSELPKLKHFYGGRNTLKFPLLSSLAIHGCEIMKSFSPMLPDAPNLAFSTPEISKIMTTDPGITRYIC